MSLLRITENSLDILDLQLVNSVPWQIIGNSDRKVENWVKAVALE